MYVHTSGVVVVSVRGNNNTAWQARKSKYSKALGTAQRSLSNRAPYIVVTTSLLQEPLALR